MMETPATLIEANDDSYERYIFRYIYIYISKPSREGNGNSQEMGVQREAIFEE